MSTPRPIEQKGRLDGDRRGAHELVPLLQEVQSREGYLSEESLQAIADELRLPLVDVYGVATFYHQFRFNKPGRHSVKVCVGTACHVKRAQLVLDKWEEELGCKAGETTEDGAFDLERVDCVGCCSIAPVVIVDDEVIGNMRAADVEETIRNVLAREAEEDG